MLPSWIRRYARARTLGNGHPNLIQIAAVRVQYDGEVYPHSSHCALDLGGSEEESKVEPTPSLPEPNHEA
jgi:hypothetical protein